MCVAPLAVRNVGTLLSNTAVRINFIQTLRVQSSAPVWYTGCGALTFKVSCRTYYSNSAPTFKLHLERIKQSGNITPWLYDLHRRLQTLQELNHFAMPRRQSWRRSGFAKFPRMSGAAAIKVREHTSSRGRVSQLPDTLAGSTNNISPTYLNYRCVRSEPNNILLIIWAGTFQHLSPLDGPIMHQARLKLDISLSVWLIILMRLIDLCTQKEEGCSAVSWFHVEFGVIVQLVLSQQGREILQTVVLFTSLRKLDVMVPLRPVQHELFVLLRFNDNGFPNGFMIGTKRFDLM